MNSSSNLFDVAVFPLSRPVTGPSFMSISWVIPEIGNTPVWNLLNISKLGRVRDTKFVADVINKKLLNPVKNQSYNLYRFWVTKGKPTGGLLPFPPRFIRLKENYLNIRRFQIFLTTASLNSLNLVKKLHYEGIQDRLV